MPTTLSLEELNHHQHHLAYLLTRMQPAAPTAWAVEHWAANRQVLGRPQGRGKEDPARQPNRTAKDVLRLSLAGDFREQLLS